jgi:hypothetical protein
MSASTKSDFVIYDEQFFSGMTEVLQMNTEVFNQASNNCMRLVTEGKKGDYEKESFFEVVSGLINRRVTTSVSTVSDAGMTMDEFISVKLNRRIGPVTNTRDAFKKIAQDPQLFSLMLGEQTGKAAMVDYVNTAINAVDAALAGVAALNADVSGGSLPNGPTMTHTVLVTGLSKRGDAANAVRCFVMHSKPYYDLMKQAITDKVFEVAGITIQTGNIATFNRPIVVVDSDQLVVAGTTPLYRTLGLVENGVVILESESRDIMAQDLTGYENLMTRIQGEYAFNVRVRGYKYNIGGGGENPDDSTLGSSGNWTKVSHDNKLLAGIRITTT